MIGKKIKETRHKKGLSQKDLADKLETSPQNLAQYENGKRNPKLSTIRKIAKALDVPMSELIDDWSQYSPEELRKDFEISDYDTPKCSKMNDLFKSLNETGQDKALEQIELLTKIPEYKK